MNWQEIMEQVLEINELQQEILIKINKPLIKEIVIRSDKYCNDLSFDKKSLNNAILEHKIETTPYQIIILAKINELSLNTNLQPIYTNMPESEEAAKKYVTKLKKEYELANNCLDLIFNIERLAETEYNSNNDFENTEYAKKVNIENQLFEKIKDDFLNLTPSIYENILVSNQKEYIKKLSIDSKKKLLLETFTLSYDRNAFNYFNEEKLIMKICQKNKYNLNQRDSLSKMYNRYRNSLIIVSKMLFNKMELAEIYNEFKIIYETEYFKQKINKK